MTQHIGAPEPSRTDGDFREPMRFPNLRAAGRQLAPALDAWRNISDLLVLGIALGGMPVAREVATHLRAPLDLILIRWLLAPQGPGSMLCAVNVAGTRILDDEINLSNAPSTPVEHFLADAIAGLDRREQICRRKRPRIELSGRTAILVDCAIRTGSTMKAAIGALRKMEPGRVIGAVPVASLEGYAAVVDLFDELVCLAQPKNFGNAGVWYRDFSRPDDDHVGGLLEDLPGLRS